MTVPDYPLPALGGYETYQLAQIATFIADRLTRHLASARGRAGRTARATAVRDLTAAAMALDAAAGATEPTPAGRLPRPLDTATYAAARELISSGPRSADVVSLAGRGGQGWAVVGHVPGIGPVGAAVGTRDIAEALRVHLLTRPAAELAPWAVSRTPVPVPTLSRQVDLAAFVEQLDPARSTDRAVAVALRGTDRRTDAAIRGRFSGVDLDEPSVVRPPAAARSAPAPVRRVRRGVTRSAPRRFMVQRPAAPIVPYTNAGP